MKKWFKIFSNYVKWRWEKFVDWKVFVQWYAAKSNEEYFREQARYLQKQSEVAKTLQQDDCPHRAGCSVLSESISNLTSIIWHTLNSEEEIGICTVCQREFRESDKDFLEWRKKPSFNRPSSAGKAGKVEISLSSENETDPQDDPYEILEKERDSIQNYAYPAKGLDALSDKEIKNLFEGVRELRRKEQPPSEDYDDYDIGDE